MDSRQPASSKAADFKELKPGRANFAADGRKGNAAEIVAVLEKNDSICRLVEVF